MILGMIDMSEVDAVVKLGGNLTGYTFLVWLLLRVCRERNEAQDKLIRVINKCESCPLAKAANESLIEQHHEHNSH